MTTNRIAFLVLWTIGIAIPLAAQSGPSSGAPCTSSAVQPCLRPPCINHVPLAKVTKASEFQVTFTGIICMAKPETNDPSRQAMIIQGNLFTKRHTPMLGVYKADRNSLRDASGQNVECDQTYCWTRIRGLHIRIVGDDGLPPDGVLVEDQSFVDLVPALTPLLEFSNSSKPVYLKYELCGETADGVPKGPVNGCFDIKGGELTAYPFKLFEQGKFVFSDGSECDPQQFADVVIWHGTTKAGIARLQIQSRTTNRWQTVHTTTDHVPLMVAVDNLGHAHHTTTHFALNEKLFDNPVGHLPRIVVDHVDSCDPSKKYCYTSVVSLIDVAGCSNTRP